MLSDNFNGQMDFSTNSHLVMAQPWFANSSSSVNIAADGDTATISGGAFSTVGDVNVTAGTLVIEPTFNAGGATVTVGGGAQDATLQLDGLATLTDLDLVNTGGGTASLTVNGTTTITQGTLDWDAMDSTQRPSVPRAFSHSTSTRLI